MKIEYKDFIGFYRNVYPAGYCEHLISEFNKLENGGAGSNRQNSEDALKHQKDDYQIFINLGGHQLDNFKWTKIQDNGLENQVDVDSRTIFFNGLQKCYDEYSSNYSFIKDVGNIRASIMKMQRTYPGGGYHLWHCEQGSETSSNRVIVYMLYLNTLNEEGGETEFLYQKMRVKPEENLMLMWPASYTHLHRGNPVLGDTHKYVVTGWFYID